VQRPPVPEGEIVTDVESVIFWVKNQ
jgi:precorrin-6A/cobalt-precorrin-6A reductase